MQVLENVPLAPLTTLGVGGPAKYFAHARSPEEVGELFAWAESKGEPLFILGGGSNILVADSGFDGLVVKIDIEGVEFVDEGETGLIIP